MNFKTNLGGEFIIDAVALIDFLDGDPALLPIISRHLGRIWIATTTLDEVEQVKEGDCAELGMFLVQPSIQQLSEASVYAEDTALSISDAITLVLARDNNLILITNDVALRKESMKSGINVLWSLETIIYLVEKKCLSYEEALEIARRIHLANPRFITREILQSFSDKLEKFKT